MRHPTAAELREAYAGKRVFLTGHTGFKGGWLTLWLRELGAQVFGYALPPDPKPTLFDAAGVGEACESCVLADVRDLGKLEAELRAARPDVVFHLAAQPLVRLSYEQPLDTLTTNVVGTAHVLEAVKRAGRPCAVVVVMRGTARRRARPARPSALDRARGRDQRRRARGRGRG